MNFFPKMIFSMYIIQNWRPLKIGGPRRMPSLPNGRTGPGDSLCLQNTSEYEARCPHLANVVLYINQLNEDVAKE